MTPVKPFKTRLLTVLAAFLNTIAVLAFLFTALTVVGYATLFAKGGSDAIEEIVARLAAGVLPLIFVATVNYLVFGKFRAWNQILASQSQGNQA